MSFESLYLLYSKSEVDFFNSTPSCLASSSLAVL
jgi:hypothetical protein